MSTFLSLIATEDGGLTTAGYTISAVIIFLILVFVSVRSDQKNNRHFSTRTLAVCAIAIALAMVCSMIKVLKLPQGGSVTLFSMLLITIIGYWYGPATGILCGVSYGLLQMVLDPYVLSLPQLLVDYPFAFGALGISGFFTKKKYGLPLGYLAGICGRFVFALLSGVIFFGAYAPEGMNPWVYSAGYNGSYIFAEGIITLIVLMIPAVSKAFSYVKTQVTA